LAPTSMLDENKDIVICSESSS